MEDALSREELDELRALLVRALADGEQDLRASSVDAQPVDLELSIGRLSRMDAIQHQHIASARKSRVERSLAEIRGAIARIDEGCYGLCVRCDEPIGIRRLRVRPEGTICVRCVQRDER